MKIADFLKSSKAPYFDLFFVLGGISLGLIFPQYWGILIILIFVPWITRLSLGEFPIQRTPFDIWIWLFFLSTVVGIWAAYNRQFAIQKFLYILSSIVLFYAIANQSKKNLWIVVAGMGFLGSLITTIFFLTQDLSRFPADFTFLNQITHKFLEVRPLLNGNNIVDDRFVNPNIIGGIVAVLIPIVFALAIKSWKNKHTKQAILMLILGLFNSVVLIITSSRAAWFAVLAGSLIWILLNLPVFKPFFLRRTYLLLAFIIIVITFGTLAPTIIGNQLLPSLSNPYESAPSFLSRLGLVKDSLYLLADFPFTGGGLGSFSGLYSQYILVIPFFMFSYSHNLFLDLAIELGFLGLVSWTAITIISVKNISIELVHRFQYNQDILVESSIFASLVIMLVHGIADDSIYSYSWGLPFLFLLPGLSIVILNKKKAPLFLVNLKPKNFVTIIGILILISFVFNSVILAAWEANMGALSMARVELQNWPIDNWSTDDNLPALSDSEGAFLRAISYQKDNATANYRLGMLWMQKRDFQTACNYLATSLLSRPHHRGIIKSLGYCYTWLGEYNRASDLLKQIPEAKNEMQNYIWWWQTQDRDDLATNAFKMTELLPSE